MAGSHPVILHCRKAARRLMLHRAIESTGVTMALVGPLGAWLAAVRALAMHGLDGWALVGVHLWAVWVVAVAHPRVRSAIGAGGMQAVLAIVAGTALYAGTTVGILTNDQPALWWRAGRVLLAVVIVGPIPALLGGVSLRQAAVWLDGQLGTKDRIATAFEKLQSEDAATPEARLIAAQAAELLESRRPGRGSWWRRTRATAAAAGLAAVVCLLAGVLGGPPDRDTFADRLARGAGQLSEAQRRRIAAAMRAAARSANTGRAELLRETAVVMVDADDRDRLAKLLRRLRRQGYDVRKDVPPEVLEALARMGGDGERSADMTGQSDAGNADIRRDANAAEGPARWVFSPTAGDEGSEDANGPLQADRPTMSSWQQAWQRARRRASDALARRRLPGEYRELIVRYYAREEQEE